MSHMERIGLILVLLALVAAGSWFALTMSEDSIPADAAGGDASAESGEDLSPRPSGDEPRTGASRPGYEPEAPREVGGRVILDETGRPVPNAIVSIRERPSLTVSNVRTAIDGSFLFRGADGETVSVEVWAEAGGAVSPPVSAPAPPETMLVDVGTLRLARAVALRGVVRTRDGIPIAGAAVYLMPHEVVPSLNQLDMFGVFDRLFSPELVVASRRTDAEGTFEFARAAPGSYAIGAFADGYSGQYSDMVLADRGPSLPIDIRLDAGHELTGVVVDAEGTPVEGAELALLSESGRQALMLKTVKARSGPDGRFRFPAIERRPKLLFVRAHGFASNAMKDVLPGDEVRVVMSSGVRVAGRVFDVETGAGLPWVRVGVMGYSRPVFAAAESDEDGRFVIPNAPGEGTRFVIIDHGVYDLELDEAQRETSFMGGIRLDTVVTGELGLDLPLRRGGTVSGRVVEAGTGAPLAGVRVSHVSHGMAERQVATRSPRTALSDERGLFTLRGVPPGPLRLAAHAGWSAPLADVSGEPYTTVAEDWDGRAELPDIELRVHGPLTIAGIVRNDAGPVVGARVRLFSTDWMREARGNGRGARRNPALSRSTTTDAKGAFLLGPAPRGRRITVIATHPRHPEPAEVDLTTGDVAIGGLELTLVRGAVLSGRLIDPERRPVAGVAVSFRGARGAACGAVSDAEGRFTITGLPAGKGRLVSVDEFRWIDEERTELTLPRGGTKTGVFEIKAAGVVKGRFPLGEDEIRVAELRPAGSVEDPVARALVRGRGQFRFDRVLPGRYDVAVVDEEAPETPVARAVTVEVSAGDTTEIEIPTASPPPPR